MTMESLPPSCYIACGQCWKDSAGNMYIALPQSGPFMTCQPSGFPPMPAYAMHQSVPVQQRGMQFAQMPADASVQHWSAWQPAPPAQRLPHMNNAYGPPVPASSIAMGTSNWQAISSSTSPTLPCESFSQEHSSRGPSWQERRRSEHDWGDWRTSGKEKDDLTPEQLEQIAEKATSLLQSLRGSREARTQAIHRFKELSFEDQVGCRAAQQALREAKPPERQILMSGLQGSIGDCFRGKGGKFANFVVQEAIETMPSDELGFVLEEVAGEGETLAKHRIGCRLPLRIIEYFPAGDETVESFLDEMVDKADELSGHNFGSIVISHFLEFGRPSHKSRIAAAIANDITTLAMQRKGSQVVEKAFKHCDTEDCLLMSSKLFDKAEDVVQMAFGQFGRHVLVSRWNADVQVQEKLRDILQPHVRALRGNKYGKSIAVCLDQRAACKL